MFFSRRSVLHFACSMEQQPSHPDAWLAIRRPLLVAFVFGCAVSLMTSGRLSLRLVAPATLYWTFVPLLEIAGLAAVWPWKRSPVSFARAIDLFFVGNTPWSLWLCAFAAAWAFFPPARVYAWTGNFWPWYAPALAVALWSACLDFRFFRDIPGRTPARACRDLALQRFIAWTGGIVWFMGPPAWQVFASRFRL
jgi:hypothetical protein